MVQNDAEGRNMFLWIGFYLQHGISGFAFGAARLVVSIEMKLNYEKVEMAACVVGRVRDWTLESLCSFLSGNLGRRRALVSIKVAQRWIES